MIDPKRRKILEYAGVAGLAALGETAALLNPSVVYAAGWDKALFENRDVTAVLSRVSNGVDKITPSRDIVIRAPDMAEYWTNVPVQVTSNIGGTTRIILIVEQNHFPLVADFNFFTNTESYIATRVKLDGQPGRFNIRAIVHADGAVYSASRSVYWRVGEA